MPQECICKAALADQGAALLGLGCVYWLVMTATGLGRCGLLELEQCGGEAFWGEYFE